jgi:hypothetical protein
MVKTTDGRTMVIDPAVSNKPLPAAYLIAMQNSK